jgi:hypothetical protein
MTLPEIEAELKRLFSRSVDDGLRVWKRDILEKILLRTGPTEGLASPVIQQLLGKLEQEGRIRLIRRPDAYLIIWKNAAGLPPIEAEYEKVRNAK